MNKIFAILAIFAVGGLLFANVPVETKAASNLDYMLTIAENAKKYCKSGIEAVSYTHLTLPTNREV